MQYCECRGENSDCPKCRGLGVHPQSMEAQEEIPWDPAADGVCPKCGGEGYLHDCFLNECEEYAWTDDTCPDCQGNGRLNGVGLIKSKECDQCGGEGKLEIHSGPAFGDGPISVSIIDCYFCQGTGKVKS